ncbi:MAG: hypothetical protein C4B59_00670 [Candidatus Methanogaster sp.]|uniref:Uncharacterized protein n=1 Tax=Candidatus Methanogaster sp. TaxID=3386292 RepID=A0AC61L6W1_9EURY|nr:MAG: hypothetical protein C4B59_00670 [ANME-2 cluster archaeon]
MFVLLSELIDKLVSNYDIRLKYLETGDSDPSSYIHVFTASRRADLYIKTRSDQNDLARLLASHEIAHLPHINDLIAGYREITEAEKISDADIWSGQYLDADIVHFATNIVSDYAINRGMDTCAYEPMDASLIDSLAESKSDDAYTIAMLILLSRHPHTFPEFREGRPYQNQDQNRDRGRDRDRDPGWDGEIMESITKLAGSDQFRHLVSLVADSAEHLTKKRFTEFVESASALAGVLSSVWRSDNTPWRMMKKNTDVIHERTPQYIKQEKFCEFAPETLAQKIDGMSIGSGKGVLEYDEAECAGMARELKLPALLERGLGIERPRLVTRYRGTSMSLADKKRLILFDSSNMWLERELEKRKTVWVLVDTSSSMTKSITSAKMLANTIHRYFKSRTKIITFNAGASQTDIAALRSMTAGGGTDVSSVLPHLNTSHNDPIVLISDFKFLMSHFYPFLGHVERHRPEMMFMPIDQESVARLGSLMSAWKGSLRYLVV